MAQEGMETVVIKTSIACDHCMECESCGLNIDTHIRQLKGIRQVKIDPETNTVEVRYKAGKTDPNSIRAALAKAGFDADDVKSDPHAYAKLDGCCKKPE